MNAKKKGHEYPIHLLREQLRQQAANRSLTLSRSVGRLTSCDARPCMEYRDEVTSEYAVIDQLLYLQQCRASLERCIGKGFARLRYQWRDGRFTETSFRKTTPGRVRIYGLVLDITPAAKAS